MKLIMLDEDTWVDPSVVTMIRLLPAEPEYLMPHRLAVETSDGQVLLMTFEEIEHARGERDRIVSAVNVSTTSS